MRKIGVLTYNVKHRKTYDTLCMLKSYGYSNVNVYAVPMHYKKTFFPLIEHRPEIFDGMPSTVEICKNFEYSYFEGGLDTFKIFKDEILLICGAGIIPDDFVKSHRIINAHPGYIPDCRGLDALKWAIYENKKIGVSTHLLGDYVDAGEVIERKEVKIKENDTFHAVANRVYELEILMLVNAIEHIDEFHDVVLPGDSIVHKRMPKEIESGLLEHFEKRKQMQNVNE